MSSLLATMAADESDEIFLRAHDISSGAASPSTISTYDHSTNPSSSPSASLVSSPSDIHPAPLPSIDDDLWREGGRPLKKIEDGYFMAGMNGCWTDPMFAFCPKPIVISCPKAIRAEGVGRIPIAELTAAAVAFLLPSVDAPAVGEFTDNNVRVTKWLKQSTTRNAANEGGNENIAPAENATSPLRSLRHLATVSTLSSLSISGISLDAALATPTDVDRQLVLVCDGALEESEWESDSYDDMWEDLLPRQRSRDRRSQGRREERKQVRKEGRRAAAALVAKANAEWKIGSRLRRTAAHQ